MALALPPLSDGWAFKRLYISERQRRAAMPAWIHEYNHHRPHTAIGKATPISRLTNLAGQYI
jgi:transposase InsO family protein